MLAEDIARLMAVIPQETVMKQVTEGPSASSIKGGAFNVYRVQSKDNPFGFMKGEGIDAGAGEPKWIVGKDRYKWDNVFDSLNPIDGKVTGAGKFISCLDIIYIDFYIILCENLAAKSEIQASEISSGQSVEASRCGQGRPCWIRINSPNGYRNGCTKIWEPAGVKNDSSVSAASVTLAAFPVVGSTGGFGPKAQNPSLNYIFLNKLKVKGVYLIELFFKRNMYGPFVC